MIIEVKDVDNIIYIEVNIDTMKLENINCERVEPIEFIKRTNNLKYDDIYVFKNAYVCCPLNIYCLVEEGEDYGEI